MDVQSVCHTWRLDSTASLDSDFRLRLSARGAQRLDVLHQLYTFNDLSKHHVRAVQPVRDDCSNEELANPSGSARGKAKIPTNAIYLGAVRVPACIRHG